MTTPKTFEDLTLMFQEIGERFQELGERFQETERMFKETDRKWQETDQKWKETDQKWQETREMFKETDRKILESDRKMKESDRKFQKSQEENTRLIREYAKHFAGLSDSVGFFAEGMVKPSIRPLFDQRGIRLDTVTARTEKHLNGDIMEIDLLARGPKSVLLTEVKFKLETADVAQTLSDMQRFFVFFPEYSGLTLYGAVAGMSIEESVARFAYHKGIFVLGQTGENVRILNDSKFVPQSYPRPRTRVTRKHKRK